MRNDGEAAAFVWHFNQKDSWGSDVTPSLDRVVLRFPESPLSFHGTWYAQEFHAESRKVHLQLTSSVETMFLDFAHEWDAETSFYSADWQIFGHHAYSKILGMGEAVVPLILERLQKNPIYRWLVAIHRITGENPVSPDHAGVIDLMRDDWLRWARDNDYM